jgi:hypothetical protein
MVWHKKARQVGLMGSRAHPTNELSSVVTASGHIGGCTVAPPVENNYSAVRKAVRHTSHSQLAYNHTVCCGGMAWGPEPQGVYCSTVVKPASCSELQLRTTCYMYVSLFAWRLEFVLCS